MKIKNPKTIIFITNWFHTNYGGAATNLQRLINSLIKIGYKIIVISPFYGDKDEKNIDNQQGRLIIKKVKISPIFSQTFYHISVFFLLLWLRLQLREKFIIQVFGLIQKGYVGAILFAKLFNQKIVSRITMLGSDDLLSIRKLSGKMRKLKYFICTKYDKIVCTSSKIFSETKKELFNNQNAVYIPQAVDTDLFNSISDNEKKKIRIKQNIKEDAFTLLFCGMPVYRKGFDIINYLLYFSIHTYI
jgi:glycosyltransferase involved in cell wall biosynthesis